MHLHFLIFTFLFKSEGRFPRKYKIKKNEITSVKTSKRSNS